MNFMPKILSGSAARRQSNIYQQILRHEAKVGGELFGPIPAGHRREFFCLDTYTWVWHEEWVDANGVQQTVTTRYNVRPNGILKTQNDGSPQLIGQTELNNLYHAVMLYSERMPTELYRLAQAV